MRPSQWAERYRRLKRSALPGRYRNDNAPFLQGIMDIPTRPGCEQANVKKAAQIGVSEALRNVVAYWADREPDPTGLCLPDRVKGRKIVKSDVRPMFRETPVLRRMLDRPSRDATLEQIALANGFTLDLMWAGSASSTASTPYRRVLNDEVDKFEEWAGEEPDPIGRTWKRMRTYGSRRLQMNVSTPTTVRGQIHLLVEASSVKLFYHVRCPHCDRRQRLVWPQLRWAKPKTITSKTDLANYVVRENAVWYECAHCHERITEEQKPAMIQAGYWTTAEGFVVDAYGEQHEDAETVEAWPEGTRIGMQISALYCLWERWSDIVAEFLQAEGSLTKSYNWRTETLGEAFEYQVARVASDVFADKCKRAELPEGLLPRWAWVVLATIDTQIDHFYAVIRAWGPGLRSQRIWHGKLPTFRTLDRLLFDRHWPYVDDAYPPLVPTLALIDSGGTADTWTDTTRTMQVYRWTIPRQPIVRAIKGAAKAGSGVAWRMRQSIVGDHRRSGDRRVAPADLQGWMIDKQLCNDLLASYIARGTPKPKGRPREDEDDGPEQWLLNDHNDPEYNRHMAALHKTADRTGKHVAEVWKPVHAGGRWDYRDCEAYQIAAAHMAQVHLLPPAEELEAMREANPPTSEHPRRSDGDGGFEASPL